MPVAISELGRTDLTCCLYKKSKTGLENTCLRSVPSSSDSIFCSALLKLQSHSTLHPVIPQLLSAFVQLCSCSVLVPLCCNWAASTLVLSLLCSQPCDTSQHCIVSDPGTNGYPIPDPNPKHFSIPDPYPIIFQNHRVFRVSGIRENQVFDMNPCSLV